MKFQVEIFINDVPVPFEELHLYKYRSRNVDLIVNSIMKKQEEQTKEKEPA